MTALYQAVKLVPSLSYVYFGVGAMVCLISLLLICGIKDIIADKELITSKSIGGKMMKHRRWDKAKLIVKTVAIEIKS